MSLTDQPIHYVIDATVLDLLVKDSVSRQTSSPPSDSCQPQFTICIDPFSRLVVAFSLNSHHSDSPPPTNSI